MLISESLQIIQDKLFIAKAVCILLLFLLILNIYTSISTYRKINSPILQVQNTNIDNTNIKTKDIKRSLQEDMFGKYIPKHLGDTNIKPSLLDVHLLGVMYSVNKKNSKVLIKFANGIEKTYKIGDTIPGGAKIMHILKDGVIVKRDGALERINLPKNELIFSKPLQPMH